MKTFRRPARLLLLAPLALPIAACDSDPAAPATPETVVELAIAANETSGEFSTLIAALTAADLVATLQGNGPFTVFAPTDAAFAAINLNAGNIGTVPKATLEGILLYHVAPGRLEGSDVTTRTSLEMANGGTTSISVTTGVARIDDARIVQTNLLAGNGVVHVIDAVILP
jgi:uncharacterized surface protein with fasciclin (FAS1) repeats